MAKQMTDSRLANLAAKAISEAFADYQCRFMEITKQAKMHFENCQWREGQADAAERLDLYKKVIDGIVRQIHALLEERVNDKLLWTGIKAVYSGLISERHDCELAETFFNSVTRRIFTTVGLDPQIEFVDSDFELPMMPALDEVCRAYYWQNSLENLLQAVLDDFPFEANYANRAEDVRLGAAAIESHLQRLGLGARVERVEMIKDVFYRNKGAYLVGRMFVGGRMLPLVLALLALPEGIVIDAVLTDPEEVAILFSFTRSYFHVEVEQPHELVRFLNSIMPRKRAAELYIAIGYNKHGKTLLYRSLIYHLAASNDQFQIAPGAEGMVMLVFTLPSFDLVFKIIKDYFAYPKTVNRSQVMAQYRMVFQRDRAGRLIDAQEFEHLKIERSRISDTLLEQLQKLASKTVTIEDDYVVFKHLYVERRVTPLNLFLQQRNKEAAKAAVIDFGNCLKDLARSNIFPGDMFLKNFGVTRHGRVVFYDYDELALLTNCNFRDIPEPQSYNDELLAEPWYSIAEGDIFPEEFIHFLGLTGMLRDVFMEHHSDIFEARAWKEIQKRIKRGEVLDIFPYDQNKRLHKDAISCQSEAKKQDRQVIR